MDVQEFKKKHGITYGKILASSAFQDAMLVLNVEKMKEITALQPAEIKENGAEILADLCGHLKHENDLVSLLERKEFKVSDLPAETYEPERIETLPTRKRRTTKKKAE